MNHMTNSHYFLHFANYRFTHHVYQTANRGLFLFTTFEFRVNIYAHTYLITTFLYNT